jgi:hypothetical protein
MRGFLAFCAGVVIGRWGVPLGLHLIYWLAILAVLTVRFAPYCR